MNSYTKRLLRWPAVLSLLLWCAGGVQAQDLRWLRQQIEILCGPSMEGRGYVRNGRDRAARHIAGIYRKTGLLSLSPDSSYYQSYMFPVNTFPGEMSLKLNRKTLRPGVDYLIDAASQGFSGSKLRMTTVDLSRVENLSDWHQLKGTLTDPARMYCLEHADSMSRKLELPVRRLVQELPGSRFIVPQREKLIWTVASDTIPATVFYVADSALPRWKRRADVDVRNTFVRKGKNKNVIGYLPGTAVPDSFIVFTAHYDHLGRMGLETVFPGANDNASGTALMLYLARYYAAHPQRYSVVFMAFSGEEAGLFGSGFYTEHPLFPLSAIRFLVNIDLMGDASGGITVVNGTEYPAQFELLTRLNEKNRYLPQIKSRGKAANSDHYYFSEKGVPAFFVYANGGPGHYHDIYDKPATLSLDRVEDVARLLQDFMTAIQQQ